MRLWIGNMEPGTTDDEIRITSYNVCYTKLLRINLGATAIGTTVTAAPGYPELATKHLSDITGIEFILAGDLIEATSDTGAYVLLSGVITSYSIHYTKLYDSIMFFAPAPEAAW